MKYISFLILFIGISAFSGDEINKAKQDMINSLHIDKTSKDTMSQIINSSFNLKSYKENYFLPFSYRYDSSYVDNGTHDAKNTETEYQVSIRTDLFSNIFGLGEVYSFGYTQRSWWQVYADSAFFRESNYQPELFVKIPTYRFLKSSKIKGFKLSLIHQSNGRGGEYERSWNRATVSTFIQYSNLITEVELWSRLPDETDYNPDITDYLGYGKIKFLIPYHKHLVKLTVGGNPSYHKGFAEFIYTYPLPAREAGDLFLFFKTFNGYGESLIDYNHNVNKVSIGLSISR